MRARCPRLWHALRYLAWGAVQAMASLIFATWGALDLLLRAGRRPTLPDADGLARILVIRLDLLGDVIMSLRAVRALKERYPRAEIHMLALPYTVPILVGSPYLARVWSFDVNKWRRPGALLSVAAWREVLLVVRALRAQRFDLAVSLFGQIGCGAAMLSGARARVGYRGEGFPFTFTHPVAGWRYRERKHEIDYCLALARAAGAHPAPDADHVELSVEPRARQAVAALLSEFEVGPGTRLVVVHVGAHNGTAKRWLPAAWAEVCDRLARDLDARVALTGTAHDYELVRQVYRATGRLTRRRPIVLAGRTTIPHLVALLQRADLVMTGDSAPLHVAAAVDRPIVAIFGPTDPAHTGPRSSRAVVLREDLPCSPCYNLLESAECRRRDAPLLCMRSITPDRVMAAAARLLRGPVDVPRP